MAAFFQFNLLNVEGAAINLICFWYPLQNIFIYISRIKLFIIDLKSLENCLIFYYYPKRCTFLSL